MKVALKNLGCVKNQVDAEFLLGAISSAGHVITTDFSDAECIIVNTCGFIESAKTESIEEIFELLKYKKEAKCKMFIVTGCLAQRYEQQLKQEMPEVDAVYGVGSIVEIKQFIENNSAPGISTSKEGYFLNNANMPRSFIEGRFLAYTKIADGCDNRCTYCAIPLIRGPYRSRTTEDILAEVRSNISAGIKEINLIAQDTTSYGKDLYGKRKLSSLLKDIASIEGDFWVRILYCYPEHIDEGLLEVIASYPKICKYIDMAVQHVHPEIVKKMNRKIDGEQIIQLIHKIRSTVPGIVLRSTFIVGFPGEKIEHFTYLKNFVREAQFDWAGVFAYSREENTPADKMLGHKAAGTKINRQIQLTEIQNKITAKRLHRYIGKKLRVLIEERCEDTPGVYLARSPFHAPEIDGEVYITSSEKITVGTFTDVIVTHVQGLDLIGEKKL